MVEHIDGDNCTKKSKRKIIKKKKVGEERGEIHTERFLHKACISFTEVPVERY